MHFTPCPVDPCLYIPRHPVSGKLSGALGVHVDDGIHGGDEYFHEQIAKLEAKYPFGSKKSQSFTSIGIGMRQNNDNSIELSQSTYCMSKTYRQFTSRPKGEPKKMFRWMRMNVTF